MTEPCAAISHKLTPSIKAHAGQSAETHNRPGEYACKWSWSVFTRLVLWWHQCQKEWNADAGKDPLSNRRAFTPENHASQLRMPQMIIIRGRQVDVRGVLWRLPITITEVPSLSNMLWLMNLLMAMIGNIKLLSDWSRSPDPLSRLPRCELAFSRTTYLSAQINWNKLPEI